MPDPTKTAFGRPAARPVAVGALARFILGIFFRQIEVVGAASIPIERPLMVVANHPNGLVDPAVLMAALPVRPRFLAKSTLWSNRVVRPFLELAAAIPVFRRQDVGEDTARNSEMFAACHEVLRAGNVIAIFPEGRSHNEPAVVELRTGVSRIVLEAEHKFRGANSIDGRSGASRINSYIVPVGLTYDDKARFRSRVLVHVGEPLDPGDELDLYADEPRRAVASLTDRVRRALELVTLNFPSWDEARLIERAAEIFERPETRLPAERSLGDHFELRRTFIEGYASLRDRCGDEVQRVAAAVREYDERLEDYRLRDAQVASSYPTSGVALFVFKSLGLMLLRAPLAILGILIHYPAYWVVRRIARRFGKTPDLPATYKVFGAMIFYPLTWLVLSIGAGMAWGFWAAALALIAGPLSGHFALRFYERRRYFLGQARAYLVLRSGRPGIEELRRLRQNVLSAVLRLVRVYQQVV